MRQIEWSHLTAGGRIQGRYVHRHMVSQHRNANGFCCTLRCANRKESQKLNFAKCQGRGQGGSYLFQFILRFKQFQEDFFAKNRQTLFGALKYRQTLFNVQILLYKDFYDSLRFTQQSPVVNSFPSFAIQMRVANWRPTYLVCNVFCCCGIPIQTLLC